MTRKNHSSVSQLVKLFRTTLSEIGREPSAEAIESAAFLVFQAMTGRSRDYHGVGHVFAVASGLPPLGRLAAIYHDTVYRQVDQGFIPAVWQKIGDVCKVRGDVISLANRLDERAADVAAIFGYEPGQPIDLQGGVNEFLSAILAVRELYDLIDRRESWTVAACIEATIPFRGRDAQGRSPAELLKERLSLLASKRGESFSGEEIDAAIRLAVRVANSDVQSFAQADVGAFLDDTWKLLPETNPEFLNAGTYSVRSYREALTKTEAFLSTLDPETIFQQYGDVPSERVYGLLRGRAQANLARACEYLRAKIVTVSVLEALADITGGDAPLSYFTGSSEVGEVHAHSFLPDEEALPFNGFPAVEPTVLHVLNYGRTTESRFDTTQSPLSAHFYEHLGSTGISAQYLRAKQVHQGIRAWKWFLDGIPRELVSQIARAIAEIALERRAKLLRLANKAPGAKANRKAA